MRSRARVLFVLALVATSAIGTPAMASSSPTNTVSWNGTVHLQGSPASDGTQYTYSLRSADNVSDFHVNVTGNRQTQRDHETAMLGNDDSMPLSVSGNAPIQTPQVALTGVETTSSGSWSGTASPSASTTLTIGGNTDTTAGSVTWTGQRSTSSASSSFTGVSTGTSSWSLDAGNQQPVDGQVTFEGDTATSSQSTSGTTDATSSVSVDTGGNVAPSGSSLSVTGHQITRSASGSDSWMYMTNPTPTVAHISLTLKNTGSSSESGTVAVHINSTTGPTPIKQYYSVSAGSTTTVSGYVSKRDVSELDVNSRHSSVEVSSITTRSMAPGSVSVSSNAGSASFSSIGGGDSGTQSIPLSAGSDSLSISSSGGGTLDYSLSWTRRTATIDPSVSIGGSTVSYSGTLADGETATKSLSGLSTGSNTLDWGLGSGPSYSATVSATEVSQTEDPLLSVDGTTVASYSGLLSDGETLTRSFPSLSPGTHDVAASASGGGGYNVSWTEHTVTDSPSVDVDGDGVGDVSYSGTLQPGHTVTKSVSELSRSSTSADVSTTNSSTVALNVSYTEVTDTPSGTVEVNGHNASFTTLSDGQTQSLSVDPAWLSTGTNRVNVSPDTSTLSADAPSPAVGFDYSHSAIDDQVVQYTGQQWSESYNVTKTFGTAQQSANLTIPFAGDVVGMRRLQSRSDGNSYSSVSSSSYELHNTTLQVDLGDVQENETVNVVANGSKVRVNNGSIQVLHPSPVGQQLHTEFRVESRSPGFYIDVSGTPRGGYLHQFSAESWKNPAEYSRFASAGSSQKLYLPNAPAGATANVSTTNVMIDPEREVDVQVIEGGSTPILNVTQGASGPGKVTYTLTNAESGTDYWLYSRAKQLIRDQATAASTVALHASNGPDLLEIKPAPANSSGPSNTGGSTLGSGVTGPISDGGGPLSSPVFVIGVGFLALALVYVALRQTHAKRRTVWLGTGGAAVVYVAVVAIMVAPGALLQPIGQNIGKIAPIVALALVAGGLYFVYQKWVKGSGPRPIVVRGGK